MVPIQGLLVAQIEGPGVYGDLDADCREAVHELAVEVRRQVVEREAEASPVARAGFEAVVHEVQGELDVRPTVWDGSRGQAWAPT
jgi:hypothetical protein